MSEKLYPKNYYIQNKEKILLYQKKYYLKHRIKKKNYQRKYRLKNYDKVYNREKIYQQTHREKLKPYYQKWRKENKERKIIMDRKYYIKNRRKVLYSGLYTRLKRRALYEYKIPFDMDKVKFYIWYDNVEKKCKYCDLSNLKYSLFRTKKINFTIDRKDNNKGYSLDNICLACPLCNFLKSSIFTYQEWKNIAQKYIKPKWRAKENGKLLSI